MTRRIDGDLAWSEGAPCTGVGPEVFFSEGPGRHDWTQARALCASCPLTVPCGEYAERNQIPWGMWAGKTPQERGWTTGGKRLR